MQAAFVRKAAALKTAFKASWRTARDTWSQFGREQGLRDVYSRLRANQPRAALKLLRDRSQTCTPKVTEDVIRLFGVYNAPEAMLEAVKSYMAAGFRPSSQVWTTLLRSSTKIDENDLIELATKAGPGAISEELLASMIRYHSKQGRPDLCEAVFERYEQELEGSGRYPGSLVWKCMIDARGYLGDMHGAMAWFDAWRTSLAHPYGFMELDQPSVRPGMPAVTPAKHRVAGGVTFNNALQASVGRYARSASTMADLPAPDPRPYAAFLRHLVDWRPHSDASLTFLELMAADRVPLARSVLNTLIYHEAARGESQAPASMLSIYEKMRTSERVDHRPDYRTFSMLFENAYIEPGLDTGRSVIEGGPTKLQQQSGLPPPAYSYLADPRALMGDMMRAARTGPLDIEKPVILDTRLVNNAIGAFVRSREYVGAAAVLDVFQLYHLEPNTATHAIVLSGLIRAQLFAQAFRTSRGVKWYTEKRKQELLARRDQLNDLDGYSREDATYVVDIDPLPVSPAGNLNYLVTRTQSRQKEPRLWGGRAIPRCDWEVRATKKYETRDMSDLKNLLHMASPFAEDTKATWERRVAAASKEMRLHDEVW